MLKKRRTSGILNVPAMIREPRRFEVASDVSEKIDDCAPVSIIGFPRLSNMNESAEQVYG